MPRLAPVITTTGAVVVGAGDSSGGVVSAMGSSVGGRRRSGGTPSRRRRAGARRPHDPSGGLPHAHAEEALAELDHVVELGLKAVMLGSLMPRPLGELTEHHPELARRFG